MTMDLQKEMPALVRFEVRAVEDRGATIANGTYTTKDVEFALITPPYSRDCVEKEVREWKTMLDQQVRERRIPEGWRKGYLEKYDAWKKGLEIPEDGYPIRGWAMISPSQQNNLIQIGVRTVEALAKMNDEGMKRYGMGSQDLKNRAAAWLKTAKDIAPVAQQNAALKAKVATLEQTIEEQGKAIDELKRLVQRDKVAA